MKFHIIGIDDNAHPHLSDELRRLIGRSKIFSGGARHRQIVGDLLPSDHMWIEIAPPMSTLMERYDQEAAAAQGAEVVIFASGDPMFYGFGSTLQRYRPQAQMALYPTFNSLQMLAHRAQIAYHTMRAVSLTGRVWREFDRALIEGEEMIGLLTDTKLHTPRKIAQRMLEYGYDNYSVTLGELLGNRDQERVRRLTLKEIAAMEEEDFRHPANMILERTHPRNIPFGIADSEFRGLEGRERMITKRVIRLAALSALDLHAAQTLWDVGFCTGSVSIEAKLRFGHLNVVSFEKREECREIIAYNMSKFGAVGIDPHIGDFMECDISGLPSPDAIFIGGYGGRLDAVVERCVGQLKGGGTLVMNSVSPKSRSEFESSAQRYGLTIEERVTMAVDDFNSITIIKTRKANE